MTEAVSAPALTSARTPAKANAIPVFFSDALVAPPQLASPSAHKPAQVVARWQARGHPVDVRAPRAASAADLCRAHDEAYVADVLALRAPNGFSNVSAEVAATLPFTSGAMLCAAEAALANGRVAVAPVSGFHHAGFAHGGGFCTFNGLLVAACALHAAGRVRRVGILDFDQHYGDGTDDIVRRRGLGWIRHFTAGRHFHAPSKAERFLREVPDIVGAMHDCDLILYQAGADPHIDDPLGGWLTTEQLRLRDLRVFEATAELRIPVAWNLAGGYQEPLARVIDIHDNTMEACCLVYAGCHPVLAGEGA